MVTSMYIAVVAAGVFLTVGTATGGWKAYHDINGSSHRYVNVSHQASLMYSFAIAIVGGLAYFSGYVESVRITLVSINVFFFAFAIVNYIAQGIIRETSNTVKNGDRKSNTVVFMVLGIAEFGTILALTVGVIVNN